MSKRLLHLAAGLVFLLGACGNPLNKAYTDKTVGEDLKSITESGKLDTTQRQLLAMYLVRAQMTKEPLLGSTYQEILNKAEALKTKNEREEAQAQILAANIQAEAAARLAQLRRTATVTVYQKGFQGSDFQNSIYQDAITMKMAIQNKSNMNIKAITGTVSFADLFDKPIKKVRFTYDEPIKSGQTNIYAASLQYNQFMDGDQVLRSKELNKLNITWEPETILFENGISETVQQAQ